MLFVLGIATALAMHTAQAGQATANRQQPSTPADSSADTLNSLRRGEHRRLPVTAELERSAFKDASARTTLLKARKARLAQDSALVAYDAMSYERISAGMSFTKLGRDRLIFRHEDAAHVRWQRGVGAWIDIKGSRTAAPMINAGQDQKNVRVELDDAPTGIVPYFPGYEPLWVGDDIARAQVDESEIVNPIADGAEAYYTYSSGDSLSFRLPNGQTIRLRELKVRPRQPKWNLAVGSLWFDTGSGQLVRAAYRLSIPMDIWAVAQDEDSTSMDDVPVWVKPMITPMRAEVAAIAIEYGLHEGRFWLPRLRLAEGSAQVSFMHVPFKMEQSFTYASVNGRDTLPPIVIQDRPEDHPPDSLSETQQDAWRDSVRSARRARTRAEADSVRRGLKVASKRVSQCDTATVRVSMGREYDSQLAVATRIPCNDSLLRHSPDLPPSIYDSGDELFGASDLDALKSEALSMTAQAPFTLDLGLLPPPTIAYGPSMMRYNRVEGLSFGISADQQLGGGYAASGIARFGLADREPNLDLTLTRTNVTESVHLSAYNHLVSASDWGHPLNFSSSFSALVFGRDEGFYYRASGAELGGGMDAPFGGAKIDWRAFVERQRSATPKTTFSFTGGDFPANIVANRGTYAGLGAHLLHSYGQDPSRLRLLTNVRVEAAASDSVYGRAALDLTASRGLGSLAASVTVGAGSSIGAVPVQRRWFLGGTETVRGQSADTTQSGNAFWLTRAELGTNSTGVRPTVFADLGWAGDRTRLQDVGRPMSGVGAGVSFLDGLVRFDVARGLYPRKQFRFDFYLEARF
jgi:hypothetical protein